MKVSKKLFLAAALTGAMSAAPTLSSVAVACGAGAGPVADKEGCQGKTGGDKASCSGKGKHEGKKDKGSDKAACSGKHGCGSKDKS
jgi:hypothetical protein